MRWRPECKWDAEQNVTLSVCNCLLHELIVICLLQVQIQNFTRYAQTHIHSQIFTCRLPDKYLKLPVRRACAHLLPSSVHMSGPPLVCGQNKSIICPICHHLQSLIRTLIRGPSTVTDMSNLWLLCGQMDQGICPEMSYMWLDYPVHTRPPNMQTHTNSTIKISPSFWNRNRGKRHKMYTHVNYMTNK